MEQLNTPVLFLVFNRPEKTIESFNAIREAKPKKLYVAVDAPREDKCADIELCKKVREIVQNVDWDCDAHYLFHEKNLGCSLAGKTAWDWFFSKEEEMIFIEDDGVASSSFFFYCQELLEKYRNDNRIAYIGGVNYGIKSGNESYFFSKECAATYAMGTWKRVHELYEYDMDSYEEVNKEDGFRRNFINRQSYLLYRIRFNEYRRSLKNVHRNTYDIQMIYLSYKYDMYSIYPNINLVSNIGLDGGANNKVHKNSKFYSIYANRPRFEMEIIIHPLKFHIDEKDEYRMFKERSLHNKTWLNVFLTYYLKSKLRESPFVMKIYRRFK
jgi:hypothetical protein